MSKMPEFYTISAQKYVFHDFFGGAQFPVVKLRVSGLDPNTNCVIIVDIVLRAQSYISCSCVCVRYFTSASAYV